MSCPHLETTLAWTYGEAPESHLDHVVSCAECRAVLEEHERVLAAVSAVAPALRRSSSPPVAPVRRSWRVPAAAAGLLLLAAAAVLFAIPADRAGTDTDSVARAADVPVRSEADVDAAFDDLDAELDQLATDLSTL
jgi:hypothetical protein